MHSMTLPRLYTDLSDLWPIVSPFEDYAGEAESVIRLLRAHLGEQTERWRVLELGCGAGQLLSHLAGTCTGAAVDVSAELVAQSRAVNPHFEHHVADMREVRLSRTFDAVLATDALDYMVREQDLASALGTAAAHLAPGGVLIASATYVAETFEDPAWAWDRHERGGTEVVSFSHVRAHPSGVGIELTIDLMVAGKGRRMRASRAGDAAPKRGASSMDGSGTGKPVGVPASCELRLIEDRHHCGLFEAATWRGLLTEAGFDVVSEDLEAEAGAVWVGLKRAQDGRQ